MIDIIKIPDRDRIVIKVDSQQLSSLEKCPRRFEFEFIHDLESKFKAKALRKGGIMADALDAYYQGIMAGRSRSDNIIAGMKVINGNTYTDAKNETALQQQLQLVERFAQYCTKYSDDYIIPVSSELGFSVPLYEDDKLIIIYEGRPDLTFKFIPSLKNDFGDRDLVRPMDHKTEASHRPLHSYNNQFLGYSYALKSDLLIVNYIGFQKTPTDDTLSRTFNRYSKEDLIDWKNNAVRNIIDLLKFREENYYPKRRSNCDTKYGLCIFTRICDTQEEWTVQQRTKSFFAVRDIKWSAYETASVSENNQEDIEEEI